MNKCLISIIFLSFSGLSYGFEKGVGVDAGNEDVLWNTSLPYAVARQGLRSISDDEYIVSFMSFDDHVLGLSDNARIIKVNKDGRLLVNNWRLTPWLYDQQPHEIVERAAEQEVDINDFTLWAKYPVGCYGDNQLNYGDMDSDGANEIIVFMGNTMVLFSPQYGKTIFSTWMSLNDWYYPEDGKFYFEGESGEYIKTPEDPQYESRLIHRRGPDSQHEPGYRGYSKIYLGDFDGDKSSDIIVWRKIYVSKLESDTQRGFELVRNEWNHYERDLISQQATDSAVTGEYLPQVTSPEIIQGWLEEHGHTWRSGFPSVSECEREKGQLIPEMHDSLLNDSDVLH